MSELEPTTPGLRSAELRNELESRRIARRAVEVGLTPQDQAEGVDVVPAPTQNNVPPARMRVTPLAPPLPSREELAEYAMNVYRRALANKKTVVIKHRDGTIEKVRVPDPQFGAAAKAVQVVGEVAGYGQLRRLPAPTREGEEEERHSLAAEEALVRMQKRARVGG